MALAQMGEIVYNYTSNNPIKATAAVLLTPRGHDTRKVILMQPHSTPQPSALKVCVDCNESKPAAQFSKNRNSKDGLNSYCKPCASARYKLWREQNQEKRSAYMREWHQANLEHETSYKRERYRSNEVHRRHVLELGRAYRQRNADDVRQRHWQGKKAKGFQNDMTRARTTVNRAVRRGILPPAWSMVCDGCQEAQAAHWHHHQGYERQNWLNVVSLCLDCHGKEHRANG